VEAAETFTSGAFTNQQGAETSAQLRRRAFSWLDTPSRCRAAIAWPQLLWAARGICNSAPGDSRRFRAAAVSDKLNH